MYSYLTARSMPGRGGKGGAGSKPKKKAFKPKQQKKRFIRSKDPILAVLMWGIEHSVSRNSFVVMFPWMCVCILLCM